MSNYQQGKIYQIVSSQTDRVYIGSTCQLFLCDRLDQHKNYFKRYQEQTYHYIASFEILKFDDARIALIEYLPCNSKEELQSRETHWMNEFRDKTVNPIAVIESPKNKYNKQYMKEYNKQYNKNQPDFDCLVCNCSCLGRNKQNHLRSKKHIDNQLDYDFAIFISDLNV